MTHDSRAMDGDCLTCDANGGACIDPYRDLVAVAHDVRYADVIPTGDGAYTIRQTVPVYVCTDCGRESDAECPFGAATCSECSMYRERAAAGLTDQIADCPAHGAFLAAEE